MTRKHIRFRVVMDGGRFDAVHSVDDGLIALKKVYR